MKIISKSANETVAEIVTNRSMTLDEAINIVGELFPAKGEDNVLVDGEWYDYDDLDIEW